MFIRFLGDPIELARGGGLSRTSIEVSGLVFKMGEPVDVSALPAAAQAKLAGNPHFEIVAGATAVAAEAADVASEDIALPAPSPKKSKRAAESQE